MKRVAFSMMISAALFVTGALAEGRIKEREERQQKRIAQGVASGQLTPRETARLESKEARLNREIRHDRKDGGKLTRRKRAKIERQQNRLNRDIYRQKHDNQQAAK